VDAVHGGVGVAVVLHHAAAVGRLVGHLVGHLAVAAEGETD
tara:strand:+ start:100 stop:222 length:123 start_codon:yes stop_codon:yes gene_type:complete